MRVVVLREGDEGARLFFWEPFRLPDGALSVAWSLGAMCGVIPAPCTMKKVGGVPDDVRGLVAAGSDGVEKAVCGSDGGVESTEEHGEKGGPGRH